MLVCFAYNFLSILFLPTMLLEQVSQFQL